MTDSEPPSTQDTIDVRQLANAVRILAFAVVIGLSIFNMGIVRSIGRFEMIFHDMLGGRQLPMITQMIIGGKVVFLAIAGAIPAVALGALLSRRVVAAIYTLGGIGLIAMIEAALVYLALVAPLIEIIKAMGGP